MNNPFKYSLDNKRNLTWNYYSKSNFHNKIIKIPVDGPFTCPNRDGSLSKDGCTFCMAGSSAFLELSDKDLISSISEKRNLFKEMA